MAQIGFIGLGNMGGPMVANLLEAGHQVKVFDLVEKAVENAVTTGATAAATGGLAASDVDVVITMLPAGKHVRSVYLDDGGVLASVALGTLLIDSSTIDVESARAVAAQAEAAGFDMVDAPVSGGVGGAAAGTLTFMVGGSDAGFARAEPILEPMGGTIVHAGGSGNGQAAKICNNMLLAVSMVGCAEAFALADKLGLDAQKLFDISSKSSGQCWSLTSYCPVPGPVPSSPANRDYEAGFTAAMMLKDLRLSQEASQNAGAATPMGAQATALYTLMNNDGHDAMDFSGIFKMLASKL